MITMSFLTLDASVIGGKIIFLEELLVVAWRRP